MNHRQNRNLSFLLKAWGKRRSTDANDIWNLFVQVLLPLVLVLTFVAALDIMRYRDVAKFEKEKARRLTETLMDLGKKDKVIQHYNHALIEVQLQKLLITLEKIKKEEIENIKLNLFPEPEKINMKAVDVDDDDFKNLCKETAKWFKDAQAEQSQKARLYSLVIEKTKNVEDKELKKKGMEGLPSIIRHYDIPNDIPKNDLILEDKIEITPTNRAKIHNGIIEFLDSLKKEVKALQSGLLFRIFNYLMGHPEQLDQYLQQLAQAIIQARDPRQREMKANEFYRRLIKNWRKKLEKDYYHFLEETWEKFQALDIE
jgi:hypothetical protein